MLTVEWTRRVAAALAALVGLTLTGCGPLQYSYTHGGDAASSQADRYVDANGSDTSALGYLYRQCTDYAAEFELSRGVPAAYVSWLGDAGQWPVHAAARGVRVNTAPAVGAVAVAPGVPGHVAVIVQQLGETGLWVVDEVNADDDGTFSTETLPWPNTRYVFVIHFEAEVA